MQPISPRQQHRNSASASSSQDKFHPKQVHSLPKNSKAISEPKNAGIHPVTYQLFQSTAEQQEPAAQYLKITNEQKIEELFFKIENTSSQKQVAIDSDSLNNLLSSLNYRELFPQIPDFEQLPPSSVMARQTSQEGKSIGGSRNYSK